jgi:hypothetical protein
MTQLVFFLLFLFPQVHGKMLRSSRRSHWSLKGERDSLLRQTLKKKLIFSLKKKKEKSKKRALVFFLLSGLSRTGALSRDSTFSRLPHTENNHISQGFPFFFPFFHALAIS